MTASQSMVVGPFALEEQIGVGGMGEVWRAVHLADRVPVAVKVVTAQRARAPSLRQSLRNEVRAMARLDHPGIVMVLDYGDVPEEAARGSSGRLEAGSPYMAVELMEGGTLKQAPPLEGWGALRGLILSILDALAHAHARGVVHRDIKPSNILLHPSGEGRTLLKLADFGLAFALEASGRGGEALATAGTPWYMAPEQIVGQWREHGPWTDIYSVACVSYQLASGRPPFSSRDRAAVCSAHCFDPMPPLAPRFAVPGGFERWLATALAKRPADRFGTAADAAHALLGLNEPTPQAPVAAARPVGDRPVGACLGDAPTTVALALEDSLGWMAPPSARASSSTAETQEGVPVPGGYVASASPHRWSAPPMPPTWRATSILRRPSMRLLGAGLGLYGLRVAPLAGRCEERDRLWGALAEVRAGARPRVVLLEGSAGQGKSRLAGWLLERASELGAATVMRATHSPMPGAADGLGPMVLRHARGMGLRGDKLRTHLDRAMAALGVGDAAAAEARALCEELAPDSSADTAQGMSREERFAVLRRYLARATSRRPLIVLLDDVQWGAEALAFAAHLLRPGAGGPLPVLVLLTVRPEELGEQGVTAADLDALRREPACHTMAVGPLGAAAHAELVQRLMGLESAAAALVEERTAGNPLFAVQLVGDWVHRGRLLAGPDGFRLAPGHGTALPDDIHGLWSGRVDRVIDAVGEQRGDAAGVALQVAALLGTVVRFDEWRRACREAGAEPPAEIVDLMADRGLFIESPEGFAFVHGMLRESLERRARDSMGWARLHRACAAMLQSLYPSIPAEVSERLARHLLAAGRLEDALDPLLAAASHRASVSDFRRAEQLHAMREGALSALGVSEGDPRWALGRVKRAEALLVRGALDEASACLDKVEAQAGDLAVSAPRLASEVLFLRGATDQKRGALAQAIACFQRAIDLRRSSGDPGGSARCLHGLAECEKLRGDTEAADAHYREAVERFRAGGRLLWLSRSLTGYADLKRRVGDTEAARSLSREALALQRRLGNRHAIAVTLNGMGDVARHEGALQEAETHYREASRLMGELASEEASLVRLNLALVLLPRREFAQARRLLEQVGPELEAAGRAGYAVYVCAGLLPCLAAVGDWSRLDAELARTEELVASLELSDDDVAECLEQAGELVLGQGDADRARRLYEGAAAQWAGLGRAEARQRALRAVEPPGGDRSR